MARRAVTPELAGEIVARVDKAARFYTAMGHGSFAPGNADGGLTTLEEKALGAYSKSGSGPIHGVVTPGQPIPGPGLYLLDVVPEGEPRWGYPNINDSAEIAELVAAGAHVVLFTTGRGSVVGSAISPVVKVCANPETYRRMADDMDVDAGRILEGRATLDEVADELLDVIAATAAGRPTASEALGHREFVLTYKSSEPTGPSCLPVVRHR
jgi:altronate hydrolase